MAQMMPKQIVLALITGAAAGAAMATLLQLGRRKDSGCSERQPESQGSKEEPGAIETAEERTALGSGTPTGSSDIALLRDEKEAALAKIAKIRRANKASSTPTVVQEPEYSQAPTIKACDWEKTQGLLCEHGVCVVENVWTAEEMDAISAQLTQLSPMKKVNRRKNRFEYVHSPKEELFQRLAKHETVKKLLPKILGNKFYLEKSGLMHSHPGAVAQSWHSDISHLFRMPQHLPAQQLATFVALVDCDASMGPTQFWRGTHIKANVAEKRIYVHSTCKKGALVMYDPRIMHRGGANESNQHRPLLYLTFSRSWYRDIENP